MNLLQNECSSPRDPPSAFLSSHFPRVNLRQGTRPSGHLGCSLKPLLPRVNLAEGDLRRRSATSLREIH